MQILEELNNLQIPKENSSKKEENNTHKTNNLLSRMKKTKEEKGPLKVLAVFEKRIEEQENPPPKEESPEKEKVPGKLMPELDDKKKNGMPSYWVMALDNGLIMFIMFCILYAVMGFFSKNQPDMNGGWITLIATSAIAGCGLAFFYRMMADNSKTKSKKKKWTRGILVTLELIAIWMIAFGIIAFIPASINRTMSPIVYAILGVAGYFVRRYLKGKLHFQNMAF